MTAKAPTSRRGHALTRWKDGARSPDIWLTIPISDDFLAPLVHARHQSEISDAITGAHTVTKIGTCRTLLSDMCAK